MRLTFGNPFPVEVGERLDQVEVLHQHRPVGSQGQGQLIAGNRATGPSGGEVVVCHIDISLIFKCLNIIRMTYVCG
ncbi:Uncharacterised protein [Mycobacteroides abscessus subsp. abscessus]|nr:Uncharacterised protein [Mycobacteroides abscessus subsp. abscessus]